MSLVAERAIGHKSLGRHIMDLRGVASNADHSVGSGPVILHITMTNAALHRIDAMPGTQPRFVAIGGLLFVAVRTILFPELHAVAIRNCTRWQSGSSPGASAGGVNSFHFASREVLAIELLGQSGQSLS